MAAAFETVFSFLSISDVVLVSDSHSVPDRSGEGVNVSGTLENDGIISFGEIGVTRPVLDMFGSTVVTQPSSESDFV